MTEQVTHPRLKLIPLENPILLSCVTKDNGYALLDQLSGEVQS